MVTLPRSARLAAWSAAWLRGDVSIDDVVMRVQGDDEPHDAAGVPGTSGSTSLSEALWALRGTGARGLQVVLPVPGDPRGLGGPAALNSHVIDVGEAVLAVGAPYALIPDIQPFGPPGDQGHLVTWHCRPADPPVSVGMLPEAEHAMTTALLDAGAALTQLDIAKWRPEVAALLDDVRSNREAEPLPRGFPTQAQTVAARSARLLAVVDFALGDDGTALSSAAAESRRTALTSLGHAARHALVAACNVWSS